MPQPFIPEHIYKRSEIHDQYGGNRQSGICPSADYPYIFIFSGSQGLLHGYRDRWENPNVFSYSGEGQTGNMKFVKGNLALRDHLKNGKRVFLFEYVQSGYVKYVTELEFFDVGYFETHDTGKQLRIGIKFFFKKKGVHLPIEASQLDSPVLAAEATIPYEFKHPNTTERQGLVTTRVGHGAYRKSIIHRWQYKCAVTGFDKLNVLIASHIVPWKDASDEVRLDVNNGILLSPTYDALFDRHYISFDNSGKIILSDSIEYQAYQKIGVTGKEKINDLSSYNISYLEKHRELIVNP
jgi:5-methylcytosine-specific restriction protein A